MKIIKLLLVLLFSIAVAACGGGGGGGGSGGSMQSSGTVIQGVYEGTNSVGYTEDALLLEDGSFWDIYGLPSGNALIVYGMSVGSSSASNGSFTGSFTDFYYPGNSPVSAQLSGTYTPTTLTGTVTSGGGSSTFSLTAPVQSTYDYSTAANLLSITGSWSGGLLDGETASINISSGGTFTGSSSLGCTFSGTAATRPSGKNVFNISITFGPSPCVAANQTVSGVGITYPLGNGTNQLVVGLVNSSHSLGSAFFAVR